MRASVGAAIGVIFGIMSIGAANAEQAAGQDDTQRFLEDQREDTIVRIVRLEADDVIIFEPIYEAYRAEQIDHQARADAFLNTFKSERDKLEASEARKLLADMFAVRRERIASQEKFAETLIQKLGAQKAMAILQIDDRLNVSRVYDNAKMLEIPGPTP